MAETQTRMPGVYIDLDDLIALEYRDREVSFLPRQPVHSLLSGRFASRMRGRGLNFEEIRDYRSGDDVRSIDWKVTVRLQKPHIRVYNEERDRQALLVVDQRLSMFFGSRLAMKSVTAAQAAARATASAPSSSTITTWSNSARGAAGPRCCKSSPPSSRRTSSLASAAASS